VLEKDIAEMTKIKLSVLGRKRKNSIEKGLHNKYSSDNLFHRFKYYFLKTLKEFVNEKIYEIYSGDIGAGISTKKLLNINNSQLNNCTVKFNLELLNKTVGDIFSSKLNKKYNIYKLNHNINIINKLKNEKDEEKMEKINKLLNASFIDCLNHLRGSKFYDELKGLENKYNYIISELIKKGETEEYLELFKDVIYNYERYLYQKRCRKKKISDII